MAEPFRYKPRREKLHVDDPGLLEMITKLAMHLGLSKTHMAEILGVGRTTFYDFLDANEDAMDAYRAGRAAGRLEFAQTGIIHARSDPATWRHLSKHTRFLGLKDEPKTAKTLPPGDPADPEGAIAPGSSREENKARAIELLRKLRNPIDIDGTAEEVRQPPNHGTTGRAVARRPS